MRFIKKLLKAVGIFFGGMFLITIILGLSGALDKPANQAQQQNQIVAVTSHPTTTPQVTPTPTTAAQQQVAPPRGPAPPVQQPTATQPSRAQADQPTTSSPQRPAVSAPATIPPPAQPSRVPADQPTAAPARSNHPATRAAQEEAETYINLLCINEDARMCPHYQNEFRRAYQLARAGDYQGQRNVAYMLNTGGNGAVRQNRMQGCAWRVIILSSGHASADAGDTANFQTDCGRLTDPERAAATARAQVIARDIGARPARRPNN